MLVNKVMSSKIILWSIFILILILSYHNVLAVDSSNQLSSMQYTPPVVKIDSPGTIFLRYQNQIQMLASQWAPVLYPIAIALFLIGLGFNLLIDIILFMTEYKNVLELLSLIIKQFAVGAMWGFWVANPDILFNFLNGFIKLSESLPGAEHLESKVVIDMGYTSFINIIGQTFDKFSGIELFPAMIIAVILGLIIMMCFAVMALDYFMIQIELIIVSGAGIMMLGTAGSIMTRNLFLGYTKYFISASLRALVLCLVLSAAWKVLKVYQDIYSLPSIADIKSLLTIISSECICVLIAMLMVKGVSSYVSSMTTGSVTSGQGGILFGAVTAAAAATTGMSMVASRFIKDGVMGGASLFKDVLSGGKSSSVNGASPSSILANVNSGNTPGSFGGFKGKGGLDGNSVSPNKPSSGGSPTKNAVSTPNSSSKTPSSISNNNNINNSAASNSSVAATTKDDIGKLAESNSAGGLDSASTNTANITSDSQNSSIAEGSNSTLNITPNGVSENTSASNIASSVPYNVGTNAQNISESNSNFKAGTDNDHNISTGGAKLEVPLKEMGSNPGGENTLGNKENLKKVEPFNKKSVEGNPKQEKAIKTAKVLGKATRKTVSHVVKHGSFAISGIANEVSKFGKHISK